jgi:roadblock/LC7 domain-containing protein
MAVRVMRYLCVLAMLASMAWADTAARVEQTRMGTLRTFPERDAFIAEPKGDARAKEKDVFLPIGDSVPPGQQIGATGMRWHAPDPVHVGSWDGRQFVVVNGVHGPEYDQVRDLITSPDGQRVAYVARKRPNRDVVVVDRVEGREYDGIGYGCLRFSPNGTRVSYVATKGREAVMVCDGVEGPEYDGVEWPVFSPDSKRVAYEAHRGGKWLVFLDGVEGREYPVRKWEGPIMTFNSPTNETRLIFSPDGKHLAYAANTSATGGSYVQVVDGVEGPRYSWVRDATFSPDGKHVAYEATKGRDEVVIVDGVERPAYDGLMGGRPIFSRNGEHVAYAVRKGKQWVVIMDGAEGPEYDAILLCLVVHKDGTVEYRAVKGGQVYSVKQSPE